MGNNFFNEMPLENYVNHLFGETRPDGSLLLPDWRSDESDTVFTCKMNWTNDSERIKCIGDISSLLIAIKSVAKAGECIVDGDDAKKKLPEEELCFWNTYLKPFTDNIDIGDMEDDDSISGKLFLEEKLTSEEEQIYSEYKKDRDRQAKERIGNNDFAFDLLIRCMRYYHLLTLGAPDIVILNERRALIDAFVLLRHCDSYSNW